MIVFADAYESHYNDVIMAAIASQITSLTIVFSTVYLDTDQTKHQSFHCFIGILEIISVNMTDLSDLENLCARSRYQGQGQVNTPHRYCGV